MIYPTHGADGQPDYAHVNDWAIRCDRCGIAARILHAEHWHQGFMNDDPAYCPACVDAIAQRLVDSATPRRRSPLGLALVALIAVGTLAVRTRTTTTLGA
jgi:hypothetical protein